MKPKRLTPRQLLRGDMPGALSLWQHAPSDPLLAERVARELLALWAGLQRLDIVALDEVEQRLDTLVRTERATLAGAALRAPLFDVGDWIRRAEELDRAWEEGEEADELDWRAYQLFENLDRAALALWALRKLLPAEAPAPGAIDVELERGRQFLTDRVDLFLGLATDANAVLTSSRRGLEETDFDLWETLLPHRCIEEARDEVETRPTQTVLAGGKGGVRPAEESRKRPGGPPVLVVSGWFPVPESPLALAAETSQNGDVHHRHLKEPGGPHTATLSVDCCDAATPIRVNFYLHEEPATDLANEPVFLANCPSTIDANGNADFPVEAVRKAKEAGEDPTLCVGHARVPWQVLREPAHDSAPR